MNLKKQETENRSPGVQEQNEKTGINSSAVLAAFSKTILNSGA